MSKIRIYELAKELGVENKDVLERIRELGIRGKSSHSHSLDADEADQVRRAIIRQAVGAPTSEREVVTTRVNTTTGERQTVVERRSGNIVRRRRQSPGGELDGAGGAEPHEFAAEPTVSSGFGPAVAEISDEEGEFQEVEAPLPAPVEESVESFPEPAEQPEEAPEQEEPEPEQLVQPQPEVQGEPLPEQRQPEPPPSAPVEEPKVAAVPVRPGKMLGPKVLGRIELKPEKERQPKPDPSRSKAPAQPVVKVVSTEEEEEEGRGGDKRRKGKKLEYSKFDLDYEGRGGRRKGGRGGRSGAGDGQAEAAMGQTEITQMRASKRVVRMDEAISVGDIARQMSVKAGDVIAKLMKLGVMATINQPVDHDTAALVADEFGYQIESVGFDEGQILQLATGEVETLLSRPPVVTVMGHVDHGKTSLLDRIRSTSVAAKEHGGITQHIGAYSVRLEDGREITFIDTPGHAAFTAMRARGAQITDIVVLVVAADDGVMPQTVEAINHAKAANVPIIVAVNKIDRPSANIERIKQQLVEHGLQPEDWGGETLYFPVSALQGTGIPELLEGIALVAELKELRANPSRRAVGSIVEARRVLGRGAVATVLVQQGTLRVGDVFVTGAAHGRVRSMMNDLGHRVEETGPAYPVEITGLSDVPEAGDDFVVVESESQARDVAAHRSQKRKAREELAALGGPVSLEDFARRAREAEAAELSVILKADVHGSVEAVRESVVKLSTEKVRVRVIHAAVGGVNESDVQLAVASKAIIVGFNVRGEPRALSLAESSGVEIRFYRIIYELLDDIKKAMVGLLEPIKQEVQLGRAEVRETFSVPKLGMVAGCYVLNGQVRRGASVRLLRDSVVVFEGKMASLRRFKDDVREVQSGYECGIGIDGYNDVKSGDVIEVYEFKDVQPSLD